MKWNTKIPLLLLLVTMLSCTKKKSNDFEKWKSEIIQVEKDFNDMAQEDGLIKAFEYYAASDGVIRRGKKVIRGKNAIAEWYKKDLRPNESLTWKPTFVDVSTSGDLAYTYGDYTFTTIDSLGNKKENKGIFHTVWKRQADQTWRFVWD